MGADIVFAPGVGVDYQEERGTGTLVWSNPSPIFWPLNDSFVMHK
jgi:hypothetical protein